MVDEDRFQKDVPYQRKGGDEMQRKGERHSVTLQTTIAFGFSGCCYFTLLFSQVHLLFHIICFLMLLVMMAFILIAIGIGKKSCDFDKTELFIDLINGLLSCCFLLIWWDRNPAIPTNGVNFGGPQVEVKLRSLAEILSIFRNHNFYLFVSVQTVFDIIPFCHTVSFIHLIVEIDACMSV